MVNNGFSVIVFALAGQLFLPGYTATEPLRAGDPASEKIVRQASAPERDRLHLISLLPVTVEGTIVGRLAAYDDAATPRGADYLELYDDAGNLLGFGWFDRFGIQRTAVDRGLLQGAAELEGVFVVLTDGEPI